MLTYVIRRILYTIPITIGVTLITFILFNLVGGNPVLQKMGKHGSEREIKIMEHEMGLDLPPAQQYVFYLKQCVTLDFGRSWNTQQKITDMFTEGVGPSTSLAVPAFAISVVLSILIALLLMFFRNSVIDKIMVVGCLAGISISILVYTIFSQYFFAYNYGWFPISGYDSSWTGRWSFLLLPGIIWIVTQLGSDVLLYRTVMLDEVFQDYVRTARAKGLKEKTVLLKHVLKNAMIPIITNVVLEIPFLFLGSLVLEGFFAIPGLGNMLVQAILASDFPVIKAMTFYGTLLYILFNLISDLLYAWADPRVKMGGA
jgi:peptide/nickel transport system permease protein